MRPIAHGGAAMRPIAYGGATMRPVAQRKTKDPLRNCVLVYVR